MPIYHHLGSIPPKKHITFKKADGSLYWEELFSTLGFSGVYTTLYHIHRPPAVKEVKTLDFKPLEEWTGAPRKNYHFFTQRANSSGDLVTARIPFLFNDDLTLYTACFTDLNDHFYKNSNADEILFVHQGSGELHSEHGVLPFEDGDYLVIPRGMLYRLENVSTENRFFIMEGNEPISLPRHYHNDTGQLLETAPFSERDIRRPQFREAIDLESEQTLIMKAGSEFYEYTLAHHPFDVVGWDGYAYPWAFNIKNFQPIVGQIHLPPSIHLVFAASNFVVCNFVPRLFDFHPQAVPAPYYHNNVDTDEVLYYVEGDFMSRKGIEQGSITLHPGGMLHGPQPGKMEASIGQKDCFEYAVMVDAFRPLKLTTHVRDAIDPDYVRSWLK